MKLTISSGSVVTSDNFKEFTFGIRSTDMGIILEILRSKMYKHPIAAICREVASNARDANKEIGNKDPIKINIDEDNIYENVCESSISFIDNGPGISPDRMADVFVNYGASTKRENNQQLGGFGLGAKTPFAYTDNFTIITIVNNKKYQYVAAIEENNTGKIYLVDESESSESNGTTITIPIKKDDINTFKAELLKATYFWSTKPIFNFTFNTQIQCTNVQNGILLKDKGNLFTNNLYALIDGVPYEVDSDKITSIRYSSYTIMLFFRTGTLGISANRESIRYDDVTVRKIQEKYESFIKNLQEKTQNEINAAKTYYEAAIRLQQITQSDELTKILYDNHIVPEFNNQKVNFRFSLHEDLQIFKCSVYNEYSSNKRQIREFETGMQKVYLIDVNKPTSGRNLTIYNSTQISHFYYLDITNKLLKSFSNQTFYVKKSLAKQMRQIVNNINWFKSIGLTLVPYSSIKPTRIVKERQTLTNIPAKVLRENGRGYSSYERPLIATKIRLESISATTHVYKVSEEKMQHVNKEVIKWTYVLKLYGVNVLFVSSRRGKQLSSLIKSFENIVDHLDKFKMSQITDAYLSSNLKKSLNYITSFDFGPQVKNHITLIKEKAAKYNIEHVPEDLIEKYPASKELNDAISTIKNIQSKYPLLSKYSEYSDNLSHFNDYIKLIDAKEEYERNKMVENTGSFDVCLQGQIINN